MLMSDAPMFSVGPLGHGVGFVLFLVVLAGTRINARPSRGSTKKHPRTCRHQFRRSIHLHRATYQIALYQIALEVTKRVKLRRRFYPFGDDRQAQLEREA